MTRFGEGVTKLESRFAAPHGAPQPTAQPPTGQAPGAPGGGSAAESAEPATVKAATAVSERVFHRPLAPGQKPAAGNAVHYAYGTLVGGLYGMAAEHWEPLRAGAGNLFGTVLWAVSDEAAVPALGLAKGPRAYPLSVHAKALASHLVYGTGTELIRRSLRKTVLSS
jgi:putative membrane protein